MKFEPKFSLGSWAFVFGPFSENPWSFEKVCRYAADAGYDGVEISGFHPHPSPDEYDTPAKAAELKKMVDDLGLGISAYAPDFDIVPPGEVEPTEFLTEIEKHLTFCERMGIRILRLDTASSPDPISSGVYQDRWNRLISNWRAAAEMADERDIDLAWEFEPGKWLNKPTEIWQMVDAIDHPRFKTLFDTSHAYMCGVIGTRQVGEKELLPGGIEEFAHLLDGRISHVHFIDSDATLHGDRTSTHLPFGKGFVNFPSVIQALGANLTPLDWWCFDFSYCPTAEVDGRAAIPFMRNILKTPYEPRISA